MSFINLKPSEDISNNLLSLGGTAEVGSQELALLKVGIDSGVNLGCGLLLVKELEHERRAADSSYRVGNALALNIGSAAVAGLAHGKGLAHVSRGDEAERTDEGGGAVGKNVAVKVGRDDDVVGLGLAEELVNHRVDNLFLHLDALKLGVREGLLGRDAEETVGLGQDVGLVSHGHERALVDARVAGRADLLPAQSNLAGDGGDVAAGALRDALDGLGDLAVGGVVGLFLLDVEVLGVLADNDHVDWLGGGGDRLDGADVGVEGEALAQGDDGGGVALDGRGGGGNGAEETAVAALESLDRLLGEGDAGLLKGFPAGLEVDEVELQTEGGGESLEYAAAGGDDLLADAITGNEAYMVGGCLPLGARIMFWSGLSSGPAYRLSELSWSPLLGFN